MTHCDREGQPHEHAARVSLDGCVDEARDARELHDLVKLPDDLSPGHAQDGTIEKDVFPSSEFLMKSRADLEEARDSAIDPHSSLGGDGNPAQNF